MKHGFWLFLCLFSIGLFAVCAPVSERFFAQKRKEIDSLTNKKLALTDQIRRWEADAAQAEELSRTIEAREIERYLAPASPRALADELEPLAARMRLSDLTYALGPTTKAPHDPDYPNMTGVAQSALRLSANAPHDEAAFAFLDALFDLPGRMDVLEFSMFRAPRATVAARNLRLKIDLTWFANEEGEISP